MGKPAAGMDKKVKSFLASINAYGTPIVQISSIPGIGGVEVAVMRLHARLLVDLYGLMAQMYIQAAERQSLSAEIVDRYRLHQANAYFFEVNEGIFKKRGPEYSFDEFAKIYPVPRLPRSVDDEMALVRTAIVYLNKAAVLEGYLALAKMGVLAQFKMAGKTISASFSAMGAALKCYETGECKSLGDAFAKVVKEATTAGREEAAAAARTSTAAAKASGLTANAEIQRALQAAKMASATTASPLTTFLKSPLGWLSIGGVALVVALVLGSALFDD